MSKYEQIREVSESRFDEIVEKFNPYHDAKGRFSSASGATSFTYKPGQGKMYDNAIARERERQAAAGGGAKVKEAEDQVKGILKEGAVVKFEGMDPDMAEHTSKAIASVLETYPSVKDAFGGFSTDDPDGTFEKGETVMGYYDPGTTMIHLNNKYYGDRASFTQKYQDAVEKTFHPAGTTADSVVVHEMGHAIDEYVSRKTIPWEKYAWRRERVSGRFWNNDIDASRKRGEPMTGKSVRENLSGYASKNHAEYLAEGFAEYMTSPNPRPLATSIGKRLNTYIKKAEKAAGGK